MKQAMQLESYIKELFQTYSLNYSEFFAGFYDEDELETVPQAGSRDFNMALVRRAATLLGVKVDELISMNDEETMKWYNKYPYFFYIVGFNYAYTRGFHDSNYDNLRLLEVLFERPFTPKEPTRYNYNDVIRRLNILLKEIDRSVPGTYHKGAHITNLDIITENFCHYEQIDELVQSYLDMVARAKELFYKAWDGELPEHEIREYNFLVTAIGLQDVAYAPSKYLYYDMLRRFIGTYRAEGYKAFSSYVRIRPQRVLAAWKCAEFAKDKPLVEKFVEIYPPAKTEMRRFAMQVSKFECVFTWSDAEQIRFSPEEEEELRELNEMLGTEPLTDGNRAQEPTMLYVPKTAEEQNGDEQYAEMLKKLAGPERLGGVATPVCEIRALSDARRFDRLKARVAAYAGHREDI